MIHAPIWGGDDAYRLMIMIWDHTAGLLEMSAITAFSLFSVWRSSRPSFTRSYPLASAGALFLFQILLTVPHLKDLNRKVVICEMLKDGNENLFSHLGLVREWIEQFYNQEKSLVSSICYIPMRLAWFYNAPVATACVCAFPIFVDSSVSITYD